MLWVVINACLFVYSKNRLKKRVAFLKYCCVMKMVTNFPCFFESIFTSVCKSSYRVYGVFKFNR